MDRKAHDARGTRDEPVAAGSRVGVRVGWQEAIAATVSGLGYELVDVERAQRGLLRVTIDRIPGRSYAVDRGPDASVDDSASVLVEDCEAVTRQLQYALEVEGLDYARLEVSSPGLDRPLRREADYVRFAGQAVSLSLKQPFEGRKSWQGILAKAEGPDAVGWTLTCRNGKLKQVLGFALSEVREARLVPVVDFKGRAPRPGKLASGGGADKAAVDAAPEVDGG